jgi:hypothetical protein
MTIVVNQRVLYGPDSESGRPAAAGSYFSSKLVPIGDVVDLSNLEKL